MLNLVQVQEKLKDMPLNVVMGYANGANPQVPPYIALGELNRRKQMEISAASQQQNAGEAPTVKDQTEQQLGLMSLQKQRAEQAQQGIAQQASAQPTIPPQQGEPQQMAGGGITRLPMRSDMFHKNAYAMGGIVAFQNNEDQPVSPDMPSEQEAKDFDQATALFESERRASMAEKAAQDLATKQAPVAPTSKDLMSKLVTEAAKSVSLEDLAAEQKKAKELTGVSGDPFAASRARRQGIEEAYKKSEGQQGLNELIGFLRGGAQAKGRRLGTVMAGASEEYQKLNEANRIVNEKHQDNLLALEHADEKERDAIARGDAKALLEAKAEKDKINYNIAKLSHDKENLAYTKFQTMLTQDPVIKSLEKQRQDDVSIKPGDEKWKWYDNAINNRTKQLAEQAGYEYKMVPYQSPPALPKKEKEKKGWFGFGGDKKEEAKPEANKDNKSVAATSEASVIPAGLPAGTTAVGRTPDGQVIYQTPDGKKVIAQ